MSWPEMLEHNMRGKGVEMLHFYRDCLWEYGPKSEIPSVVVPELKSDVEQDSIIDTSDVTAIDSSNSLNEDDSAIRNYTLAILKKLRTDELPLLVSSFFGGKVLPSIPDGKKINIKHTKYKKFSSLLSELQEEDVVKVEKIKNVDFITYVEKSHPALKEVSFETLSLKEPSVKQSEPENKAIFSEMLVVNEDLCHLLKSVCPNVQKNSKMTSADVRRYVTLYVRQKGLARKNCVVIDDGIHQCLSNYRVSERFAVDNQVTWPEFFEQLFQTLKPAHEIHFSDGHVESRKGHIPSVTISVAMRTGNKKITLINNLSSHCIDPIQFAKDLQQRAAASATLNNVPQSVGPQIQVQGNKVNLVQKILMENFNIAQKFIKLT
ncbi:unnamed protein product [Soboliphyme baturini]|uniref:SUI1 domain-containing protein n=1 Tax=Soboliphyme baturini TaxID=241478 RepID=A0A183IR99_9BILA|nr:unnamed protein product [Soboliphyme baturini]